MLLASADGRAQSTAPNGSILERQPVHLTLDYDAWFARVFTNGKPEPPDPPINLKQMRAYYTRQRYEALEGDADVSVERIVYASDGLRVRGFIVTPRAHSGKLPVVVWCRGGVGSTGMVVLGDLITMTEWARRGFLVLATQYRGSTGSDGKDELGGADLHDVSALFETAKSLPDADPNNTFLYGQSRGGMMVYELLHGGAPVRAAVVNSGVADAGGYRDRPDAVEMETLMRDAVPDWPREKRDGFRSRSAVYWADRIHTPLLLLHGTADWRVSPTDTLRIAETLQRASAPYELHLFEGGTHVALSGDQASLNAEIVAFFHKHLAGRKQ